jgi:predicted aldo/keto reductase-like oxidoreductase
MPTPEMMRIPDCLIYYRRGKAIKPEHTQQKHYDHGHMLLGMIEAEHFSIPAREALGIWIQQCKEAHTLPEVLWYIREALEKRRIAFARHRRRV